MKKLIYLFVFLAACSSDDEVKDPYKVSATIQVSASSNLDYVRYRQLEEGDTAKWFWKEMDINGREAKESTHFKKGFETKIVVQAVNRTENIYITVKKDGKVVLDDTFEVPEYNPSVYWMVQF